MKQLLPLAILLLATIGCSKDKDKENPVVTLTTPTMGQAVNGGDTIWITGTVTDDKWVNELFIRVTNATTGVVILEIYLEPGGTSASFNYPLITTSGIHYRVQVIAKDKYKNDTRKIVEFICN